ncbi:MAG: sulfotransferase [Thermoanaerobaculia bacterium]
MPHPRPKILFIAGIGRSGSTLLSRMLAQIDGFQAVGELHHLWLTRAPLLAADELCGCGSSYADCRFWPGVIETALGAVDQERLDKLAQLKRETDRVRYIPWMRSPIKPPGYARRLEEYRPVVRSLYSAIESTCQPRVIVDATKDPSSLYLLSTLPELEVTVLHLVRDPRGVAFSWAKRMRRPEIRDQDVYMPRQTSWRNATYWSYSNLLAGRSRRLHRNYILLRYEDFIRRPTEWLRKICTVMGEEQADLSFLKDHRVTLERPNHILKGNPSRFAAGPLDLRADEEWKSAMPSAQKLAVTLTAAPLLLRYGYFRAQTDDKPTA